MMNLFPLSSATFSLPPSNPIISLPVLLRLLQQLAFQENTVTQPPIHFVIANPHKKSHQIPIVASCHSSQNVPLYHSTKSPTQHNLQPPHTPSPCSIQIKHARRRPMGCHSSKQARRDLLRSPSPFRRTNSLPPNNRHVVSLTSSTLGSLNPPPTYEKIIVREDVTPNVDDLSLEIAKAREWSSAIGRKIPRTPTETPPCEPEPVDARELMAGLSSPFDRRSFSFYPTWNDNVEKIETVILYFTSLRGVRKTYDDCCSVRAMLGEHGVWVDERDVSMHVGFKEELKEAMGGRSVSLPRVVVAGKHLGGEEEVRRMHEGGELGRMLEGCRKGAGGGTEGECKGCGDVRFVPCGRCSGSCRVFVEEPEEEEEEGGRGWRRCSECNENGIVRCPACC